MSGAGSGRPDVEPHQCEEADGTDLEQRAQPLIVEDPRVDHLVALTGEPGSESLPEKRLARPLGEARAEVGHAPGAHAPAALLLRDDAASGREDDRLEGA